MGWIGDHAWETWLIIAITLVLFEVVSMSFTFLMLATGAALGTVLAVFNVPPPLTILLACATSMGCLFLIRPRIVKRLHAAPELKTGAAALVGHSALVLEPITRDQPGRVKIGGDVWSALPADPALTFEPGVWLEVASIKGATAYVRESVREQEGEKWH